MPANREVLNMERLFKVIGKCSYKQMQDTKLYIVYDSNFVKMIDRKYIRILAVQNFI